MDYVKHYNALIIRAQNRTIDSYTENHHIIPRCMGGSDDKSNMVRLTPEEHYLAHQLLIKIYPDIPALVNAAIMMIPKRKSNKLYGWLRRRFAEVQRIRQSSDNNSQFGTRWIHNTTLKQNKKIKKFDNLPDGWIEGRKINFNIVTQLCKLCQTSFEKKCSEVYCSKMCKRHDRSPAIKIIDENLSAMIAYYQTVWSIDKTLKKFDIIGKRAGNSYFSSLLKARNIYVRTQTYKQK